VLSSPNPFPDQPQLRYRCRNPRCRLGLKVPASAAIDAFCTRGCYTGFFHKRCRVCERSFDRRNNRQQVCDRRKCRNAFRADRARFFSTRYPDTPNVIKELGSAHSTGVKSALAWRVVAGPAVSEANLQPPDPETAARMARADAEFRRWWCQVGARALIQRRTAPVNVLGGHHFAGAPVIVTPVDESAVDPAVAAAVAALVDEIPSDLSIPTFLKRGPAS
jgi:hypothetical protein